MKTVKHRLLSAMRDHANMARLREAAEILDVDEKVLRLAVRRKIIPSKKIRRVRFVDLTDVEAWMTPMRLDRETE